VRLGYPHFVFYACIAAIPCLKPTTSSCCCSTHIKDHTHTTPTSKPLSIFNKHEPLHSLTLACHATGVHPDSDQPLQETAARTGAPFKAPVHVAHSMKDKAKQEGRNPTVVRLATSWPECTHGNEATRPVYVAHSMQDKEKQEGIPL